MNTQTPGLLVIDLQPAYARSEGGYSHITPHLMRETLAHIQSLSDDAPLVVLHVDEELSGDTLLDVQDFWREHGADDALIERIRWTAKSYAFLRGWMDNGVDDDDIVATLKALRQRKLWDSRDLAFDDLQQLSDTGSALCDPLFRDQGVEDLLGALRNRSWVTCGGGRAECLAEVELVLTSAALNFERLDRLTY